MPQRARSILRLPPVFYGWWVVGACAFIMLFAGGIPYFGFTAVFEPLANEFGWSYTQISLAASLRGVEAGLFAPLVGFLVDRLGPRRIIFAGCFIAGFGLILLSRINSLGTFYGAFVLIALGVSTTGHAAMMAAVANWFRKRVAIASGIMASGAALGGLMIPVIVVLVDMFGWRSAMFSLGLATWALCLPVSLLIRHKPEQYGYLPDGEQSSEPAAGESRQDVARPEVDTPALQALRERTFWHVALALTCQLLVVSAVTTHVMPYFGSIGVPRPMAALMATALPVTSILGRLSFGWFGDRFNKRRVSAAGFALSGLGLLSFGYVASGGLWFVLPFLILTATGWGGNVTMRAALVREYFGRKRFGTIHGFVMGVTTLGTIVGAPLAGWIFDRWHSYQGAWFLLAGFSAVGLVLVLTIPRGQVGAGVKAVEAEKGYTG